MPVCPECLGDGRIADRSGGGHHGVCKRCGGRRVVDVGSSQPGSLGSGPIGIHSEHELGANAEMVTVDSRREVGRGCSCVRG